MSEISMAKVHRCGQVVTDERRCPKCGRPLMRLPDEIVKMTADAERLTGLKQSGISLLGFTGASYMAGWDDAMAAMDEQPAAFPVVVSDGVPAGTLLMVPPREHDETAEQHARRSAALRGADDAD